MATRLSAYRCGLALLFISSWCGAAPPLAAAPPAGQWAERPFALDGALGSATPVGNIGAWLDVAPIRWFSLYAGVGANLSGLQLAGMARVRFTPERKDSVYLGAGYSRGPFSQSRWNRFGFVSIPDGAYDQMLAMAPTPVVELNRAVAVAERDRPNVALELVDQLDLEHYHLWHATRGDLLRRSGRPGEASAAYRRAIALTDNGAERRFLERRIRELEL